uniref:UAP56-interacting factor n=1 Tax=Callorhinchus milii TaxID=7868 RepID=A0A4W3HVS6_CALMI
MQRVKMDSRSTSLSKTNKVLWDVLFSVAAIRVPGLQIPECVGAWVGGTSRVGCVMRSRARTDGVTGGCCRFHPPAERQTDGMNRSVARAGSAARPAAASGTRLDKIDMSLDDIIKLNKQQWNVKRAVPLRRTPTLNETQWPKVQQRRMGNWRGIPQRYGTVVNRQAPLEKRRGFVPLRRRPQGVITGLAARKASLLRRGMNTINRSTLNHKQAVQRPRSLLQRNNIALRQNEGQRRPIVSLWRPNQFKRRNPVQTSLPRMSAQMQQNKEARQATYLSKRGLKVHMQTGQELKGTAAKKTAQSGRVPSTNGGILTVSIQNPSASSPPVSQSFRITRPPLIPFTIKKESGEKKEPPKGVSLEFDINSVGKQTGITLNERFAILKERRTVDTSCKGGRFVTVR